MVGHNPQFTYRKDGVFYFSRRLPKYIRDRYEADKFVMSLRTKSREAAARSSRAIAARLDECWMSLRIAGLGIPKMLASTDTAVAGRTITLSQALENYHSLKGTGKDDVTKRPPIPAENLFDIQNRCREVDDDLRWLIALISDSSMRLAEAAGLLKTGLLLDHDIPHINLQPHAWRQLKTANSQRLIPLVETSLWAARRILDRTNSEFTFPRFTNMARCNSNSASATLNKWMKRYAPNRCVVHSLRHSFTDRLRAVETPSEVEDALGGWTSRSIGQSHGMGYDLAVLQRWMSRLEKHP